MYVNNLSTTQLLLSEKPCIVNGQFDKFETLLFLPPNQDRIAEGGLRKKGNFKHSYKYIVSNDCLSASRNSSFEASEDKNKSTAGVLYSSVTATAYDNTDYAESKKNKIDLNCKTVTDKWYICDTDGNPVKPAPMEIQEKIEGYIKSLQDNINCDLENTDKNEDALQRPITFLPLITVITVVFNGVKTLEETIKSVINQTYPNVEYIIIDGGSTDGTLDIIKKYEDAIDYWVSEPDKGIYDAMNKGINLATGMWINFMNAGDHFYNPIVLSLFLNSKDKDHMIYGNALLTPINKMQCQKLWHLNPVKQIIHQSVFMPVTFHKINKFDYSKYKIMADYAIIRKFIIKNPSNIKYCNAVICDYDYNGISTNMPLYKYWTEKLAALHNYSNFNKFRVLIHILPRVVYSYIKTINKA